MVLLFNGFTHNCTVRQLQCSSVYKEAGEHLRQDMISREISYRPKVLKCVCVCGYMCVCMHVRLVHACVYVCICACIYLCVYAHMCMCYMYVCVLVCVSVCL